MEARPFSAPAATPYVRLQAALSPSMPLRGTPAPAPLQPTLLPNVLLPGVSHAGAAVLATDLGRHPEVCLPEVKRIGHFTPLRYGRPVDAPLEEYDRHFARWSGQRYRVEAAPDYFDGGLPMARRVADALPGARVVIVLRDPAERLWGSYADKVARGRLPRAMGYEDYVDRSLALRSNRADRFEGNRHFRTLSGGFYLQFLPAWLETFGRRVRVVFTEDLCVAPDEHVGALFDWLGLNPADAAVPPGEERDDVTRMAYPAPEPVALPLNRWLWPVLQRTTGPWRGPERRADGVRRRSPRPPERVRDRVRALYAEANRELAALLRYHGYSGLPDWLTRG